MDKHIWCRNFLVWSLQIIKCRPLAGVDSMTKKKKTSKKQSTSPGALGSQYKVILKDLSRLKADVRHSYALVREVIETKISRRNLNKTG
jgi:hypothetical protein